MEWMILEAENYHDIARTLNPPVMAYGVCVDDNPDVILIYEVDDDLHNSK
jgi:hypothetical protein